MKKIKLHGKYIKTAFITAILVTSFFAQENFVEEKIAIDNPKTCFSGPFSTYEYWMDYKNKKLSLFDEQRFAKWYPKERFDKIKNNIECIDFTYQVDGFTIAGFYLKPKQSIHKKLPVIIYNRGGNGNYGAAPFDTKVGKLAELAKQGFIVIGSQYRGSSLSILNNGKDEFGGADVRDVLALTQLLDEIPNTDSTRIGMYGWSRGGMQTYIAAQSLPNIKAIAVGAGVSNQELALKIRPKMENVLIKRVPNFKENRAEELEKRSVIKWTDKLPKKAPILLLHGDKDWRVNVEQSIQLAAALKKENHPHKLVVYPGGNHSLKRESKKVNQEVATWFKKYL